MQALIGWLKGGASSVFVNATMAHNPTPRLRACLRLEAESHDISRMRLLFSAFEQLYVHILELEHSKHVPPYLADQQLPATIVETCNQMDKMELKRLSEHLSFRLQFSVTVIRLASDHVVMRFGKPL